MTLRRCPFDLTKTAKPKNAFLDRTRNLHHLHWNNFRKGSLQKATILSIFIWLCKYCFKTDLSLSNAGWIVENVFCHSSLWYLLPVNVGQGIFVNSWEFSSMVSHALTHNKSPIRLLSQRASVGKWCHLEVQERISFCFWYSKFTSCYSFLAYCFYTFWKNYIQHTLLTWRICSNLFISAIPVDRNVLLRVRGSNSTSTQQKRQCKLKGKHDFAINLL